MLPDMSGFELIEKMRRRAIADLPIIVYTAKDLTREEEETAESGGADDHREGRAQPRAALRPDRALAAPRHLASCPKTSARCSTRLHDAETVLAEKKVLIVDDDIRNIFAMTSVLERTRWRYLRPRPGKAAIELLQSNPDIDVVLMDIMLPRDGWLSRRCARSGRSIDFRRCRSSP